MKNYALILLLGLFSTGLFGQSKSSSFRLISEANFAALVGQMDEEIELITPNNSDFFEKDEALQLLKKVIQEIEPVAWKEKHIGGTRGGQSTYTVGHLKAASGKSYRLYIVKEKVGDDLKIVSIEIERQ